MKIFNLFKKKHTNSKLRGKWYTQKPVEQWKNGEYITTYNSVTEVQRKTGYSKSHIFECCAGRRKSAYGYQWNYVNKNTIKVEFEYDRDKAYCLYFKIDNKEYGNGIEKVKIDINSDKKKNLKINIYGIKKFIKDLEKLEQIEEVNIYEKKEEKTIIDKIKKIDIGRK